MFGKAGEEGAGKVWAMMEEIGFCMLATLEDEAEGDAGDAGGGGDGLAIRARPMAAYVRAEEGAVWFLTDAASDKAEALAARPQVTLAFADSKAMRFVSVAGTAAVSDDREKIAELWGTPAKAWWDSPDDPSLRVLKVVPREAEYWESPGRLRAYARMAAAALSGARPDMGENETVAMG